MIRRYLDEAMRSANYEIRPDGEGYYGCIPGAPGVWANADTLEVCRDELLEALEGWVLLGVSLGHELPRFGGIRLDVQHVT